MEPHYFSGSDRNVSIATSIKNGHILKADIECLFVILFVCLSETHYLSKSSNMSIYKVLKKSQSRGC